MSLTSVRHAMALWAAAMLPVPQGKLPCMQHRPGLLQLAQACRAFPNGATKSEHMRAGLAKGSRLYNRLPSDDHAQALAVDDSAMDLSCQRQASCGARPSADPWPPRQHLRTGSSGQITPIR